MTVKEIINSIFISEPSKNDSFTVDFEADAAYFLVENKAALDLLKLTNGSELATFQYIHLEMLAERGLAEPIPNGFKVPNEMVVQFNKDLRRLFELPSRFPGYFKIETVSQLDQAEFRLTIIPHLPNGEEVHHQHGYKIRGALIEIIGDAEYLMTSGEYLAFDAYSKHKSDSTTPTELRNLQLIHALQRAKKIDETESENPESSDELMESESMSIKLDQFDNIDVVLPTEVKVSLDPQGDGSYLLLPDYGNDIHQSDLVNRLAQLSHGERVGSLRVGHKRLILDERIMAATRELLGKGSRPKVITKDNLKKFLQNPSAFIDSTLINLDEGFSSRVLGLTDYIPVKFTEFEDSERDWFGEAPLEEAIIASEKIQRNAPQDHETSSDSDTESDSGSETGEQPSKKALAIHENIDGITYARDAQEYFSGKTINEVACKADIDWTKYRYKPYDYQEEGIRWIVGLAQQSMNIESNDMGKLGALLADDMGLGKTFMSLAALSEYMELCNKANKSHKPMLIVAPLTLMQNWKAEVAKFFGTENGPFRDIVILQADADLRKYRSNNHGGNEINLNRGANEASIKYALKVGGEYLNSRLDMPKRLVITTYETLAGYQFSLAKVDWSIVIFDEAQRIKNPNTLATIAAKGLKANFKLLATGTPVENGLNDFWCLMDTARPGYLSSYRDFNSKYMKPVSVANDESRSRIKVECGEALRKQVGALMCRRTKQDNLNGLPSKTVFVGTKETTGPEIYSEILDSTMSGYQEIVYDQIIKYVLNPEDTRKGKVLTALHALRNASLHPRLADDTGLKKLPTSMSDAQNIIAESSKLQKMTELLDQIKLRDEKVLIFLVNKDLQVFLKAALGKIYNLNIPIINGDVKATAKNPTAETRTSLIEQFEATPGFGIMLLSPIAAGVGLTIVGANNVIHLERHWNPAKEAQATDRVYRIGQIKNVNVYLPVTHHSNRLVKSYEQNLNDLLANKTSWSDAVVVPEQFSESEFDCFGLVGGNEEANNSPSITMDDVDSASYEWFEAFSALLLAKHFDGSVELTTTGGDDGIDSIIRSIKANYAVQSKHSNNPKRRKLASKDAIIEVETGSKVYSQYLEIELEKVVISNQLIARKVRGYAKMFEPIYIFDRNGIEKLMKAHPLTKLQVSQLLNKTRLEKPAKLL
ncbi:SNF2-related protein [Arenicella xantha]|uniref:SNF2 family DNA or RNA helicase n=1 Tax=Arenicella xantha TaxID=644221 RepID=A0A395JRA2_9GAMM|nr:SNF2-related protein [Arenicella xantha]RBP52986.1 SNF2 family DNA or RNA helicase [Arenicella xantha]